MTSPTQEPGRIPRASTYARANQRPDRYRRPLPRTAGGVGPEPSSRRYPWADNRRRFWFFTAVLVLALAVGGVTLSAVLAAPPPMAQAPQPAPFASQRQVTGPQVVDGVPPDVAGGADGAGGPGAAREPVDGGNPPSPVSPVSRESSGGDQATAGSEPAGDRPSSPDATPGAAGPPAPYGSGGRGGADDEDGGGAPDQAAGEPTSGDDVYYKNCGQARKAGADPLHRGEPGYREALDPDGDGVACQRGSDK